MLKIRISYALSHAAFIAAIWFGVFGGHEGAANIVKLLVLLLVVTSLLSVSWTFTDRAAAAAQWSQRFKAIPEELDGVIDTAIMLALAWAGWLWLAGAWMVHAVLSGVTRNRVEEYGEEEEPESPEKEPAQRPVRGELGFALWLPNMNGWELGTGDGKSIYMTRESVERWGEYHVWHLYRRAEPDAHDLSAADGHEDRGEQRRKREYHVERERREYVERRRP